MSNDVHLARVGVRIPVVRRFDKVAHDVISPIKQQPNQQHPDMDYHHHHHQHHHSNFVSATMPPRTGTANSQQQQHEIESPDHTQRDNNESDNNISSCSTLDIGKVEHLSVHQLETQVRELNQRLQQAEEQRTNMQYQLDESTAEKELCLRRLEVVSAAHECRITEMHCVIAELSKKLRAKQESTIVEEQEPEGSEISFQEGSVYNSELNLTNPDAECQTDSIDGCAAENSAAEGCEHIDNQLLHDELAGAVDDDDDDLHKFADNANADRKGQVEALQEEVLHLKAQIALLQSEIANSLRLDAPTADIAAVNNQQVEDVMVEKPTYEYYGDDVEANDCNCSTMAQRYNNDVATAKDHDDVVDDEDEEADGRLNNLNLSLTTQAGLVTPLKPFESLNSPQREVPIPKMAERVKLRCVSKTLAAPADIDHITVTEFLKSEIKNVDIVEHLVSDMAQHTHAHMLESFVESAQLSDDLQRLERKVEHLKTRNTVLTLTLDECKEHCEHLYLLCGKYESNAIALQSAVNCSDRAIEAYDVMLALLESKLALIKERTAAAEDSRKAVESVARHLLDRFESEKNVCENSLGPWQNTSFNIPDKAGTPWTPEDDNRLRYHVSKLKGRRSTVQNTIVNLESPFSDFYEKSRMALECNKEKFGQEKCAQIDLETAVLMQELLNLREENILLKTKADEAIRERQYATDRISVLQEALQQLQIQLATESTTTSQLLFRQQQQQQHPPHPQGLENRISYSEAEHSALTEQQLVEALSRESELKGRIQTLVASVSATQKISDEKHEQLHSNMRELQKSNLSLTQMLEHNKRKYQARIRKLEQKIADLTLGITQLQRSAKSTAAMAAASLPNDMSNKKHECEVPETTL